MHAVYPDLPSRHERTRFIEELEAFTRDDSRLPGLEFPGRAELVAQNTCRRIAVGKV
jgi:hypothetical protein